jgi:hypothetical protein
MAEKILGRPLHRLEKVRFVNGNTEDCSKTNLVIVVSRISLCCPKCGKARVMFKCKLKRYCRSTKLCRKCIGKFKKSRSKESYKLFRHVGDVKLLIPILNDSVIGRCFQVSSALIRNIRLGLIWKGAKVSQKKTWEVLLSRAKKLAREGRASLFDRVQIAAKIWEDSEFQKDNPAPTKVLDSLLNDSFSNFTQLYQMLQIFPNKLKWVRGDLVEMQLEMLQAIPKPRGKRKTKTRNTVTQSQYQKLAAENKLLRQENKLLRQEISHLREALKGKTRKAA